MRHLGPFEYGVHRCVHSGLICAMLNARWRILGKHSDRIRDIYYKFLASPHKDQIRMQNPRILIVYFRYCRCHGEPLPSSHCDAQQVGEAAPTSLKRRYSLEKIAKVIQTLRVAERGQELQTRSKSFPNSPETHPKSIKNQSSRPLGAYVGSMLCKSWLLKVKQIATRRPRMSQKRPRRPQTLPNGAQDSPKSNFDAIS